MSARTPFRIFKHKCITCGIIEHIIGSRIGSGRKYCYECMNKRKKKYETSKRRKDALSKKQN